MTSSGESVEADLVAISRDALLLTDRTGKIRFANPAAATLLNAAPGVLATRLLVTHVDRAHRRSFRTYVNRAAGGETLNVSFDLRPGKVHPFPVRARIVPLRGGLGWVLRDESAAAVAPTEAAGEGLERVQLGRVLEGVRDGVIVLDRELRVRFANRSAQLMLAPDALAVGDTVAALWTVSIADLVRDLFEHEAFNAEAVAEPDERSTYWVRAYQSGAGDSAVLLLSDLGDEERREQAERDFVANAAHELQSPLTGIATAVEVLLAGAADDEDARGRFLEHVSRESARLARLLRSLLLLAQATESTVETESFELLPLLEQTVAHEARSGAPRIVCPPTLRVHAHRELVEHALSNLVANAIRHGGGGLPVLTGRRGAGGSVVVDVVDSGPGLSPEERVRVFQRFYRGGARTPDGFGLGLAIAEQAARAVGGGVKLLANPRGGTIARLTLRGSS